MGYPISGHSMVLSTLGMDIDIAGVATSYIEALRADRFPLSNEQMGQL
jgi:hypothetical protein